MKTIKKFDYHPIVSNIIENNYVYISKRQEEKGIISDNLHLLLALHIFKYSLDDLYIDHMYYNSNMIRFDVIDKEISFLCDNVIRPSMGLYENMYHDTLPSLASTKIIRVEGQLYETDGNIYDKISFGIVSDEVSRLIQTNLHYIGSYRNDTIFNFGLFRNNANVPFAYSSYSILDRKYLLNLPYFKNMEHSSILVNTRNFGFKNNPKNAMSVLFAEAIKYFKYYIKNYHYIVSAINPNLMFSAASYFSSSFIPIATSPLDYNYINGIYASRRKIEECTTKYLNSKTKPYPIYWFVKSINKKDYTYIMPLIDNYGIINITENQYLNK